MREKYESLSLTILRDLAKARGLKGISAMRKPELIDRMCEEDEKDTADDRFAGRLLPFPFVACRAVRDDAFGGGLVIHITFSAHLCVLLSVR